MSGTALSPAWRSGHAEFPCRVTRCGRQLASEKGQAALAGSKCMAQMHALYDTAREVFEHQWAELAACK